MVIQKNLSYNNHPLVVIDLACTDVSAAREEKQVLKNRVFSKPLPDYLLGQRDNMKHCEALLVHGPGLCFVLITGNNTHRPQGHGETKPLGQQIVQAGRQS